MYDRLYLCIISIILLLEGVSTSGLAQEKMRLDCDKRITPMHVCNNYSLIECSEYNNPSWILMRIDNQGFIEKAVTSDDYKKSFRKAAELISKEQGLADVNELAGYRSLYQESPPDSFWMTENRLYAFHMLGNTKENGSRFYIINYDIIDDHLVYKRHYEIEMNDPEWLATHTIQMRSHFVVKENRIFIEFVGTNDQREYDRTTVYKIMLIEDRSNVSESLYTDFPTYWNADGIYYSQGDGIYFIPYTSSTLSSEKKYPSMKDLFDPYTVKDSYYNSGLLVDKGSAMRYRIVDSYDDEKDKTYWHLRISHSFDDEKIRIPFDRKWMKTIGVVKEDLVEDLIIPGIINVQIDVPDLKNDVMGLFVYDYDSTNRKMLIWLPRNGNYSLEWDEDYKYTLSKVDDDIPQVRSLIQWWPLDIKSIMK